MDAFEPIPTTARPEEALAAALGALSAGATVAIATVLARRGSSPATPGQKLAVWYDAASLVAIGTVGGGAVERAVLASMIGALDAAGAAQPKVHTYRLGAQLGMCCGGSADILVEVMRPAVSVLLVGAGHVGLATAKLLPDLGFRCVLSDTRASALATDRVSPCAGVVFVGAEHDDPEVLDAIGDPARAALVVMTHDHQLDQRVIEWGLARSFSFVGGVGSRAKAARMGQRLEAKGVARASIERVRMPVGLAIGARSPAEIALAIAGELVAWRAAAASRPARGAQVEAPEQDVAGSEADAPEQGAAGLT